jgi:Undecaprenyl-phosphate glucose phosphotransferase
MSQPSVSGHDMPASGVQESAPSAELKVDPEATTPNGSSVRSARRRRLRTDWLPIALIGGDAVIAAASVLVGYVVRYGAHEPQQGLINSYLRALPIVVALYIFSLGVNHQYSSWRGRTLVDQLLALYSGIGVAAVLVLATIALLNLGADYSRLSITYGVVFSALTMTLERYLLRQYETRMRRKGIGTEDVLMIGGGVASELLIQRMNMFPQYGYRVCAVLDDNLPIGSMVAGVSVAGRTADLPELVETFGADQVFIALPSSKRDQLLQLIKLCEDKQLEFKIVPDLIEVMSSRVDANTIDGLPLVGIRRSRMKGVAALIKRGTDVVASSVGLIVLSPLLLVIAIVTRLTSRGPLFFKQERVGMHRRRFTIIKFRTMVQDADAGTGLVMARPGDSRVTPFGRLLRKTSLDELPQLYNILRGDMSVVGPRPQATIFDERYQEEIPRYLERHVVRPGLTGWAEVNDLRGAAPIGDRTLYDVYYIENWSLALDVKIIVLTVLRLFFQRNAY